MRIDINADVGEWTGDDPARATDAALLPFVTTINVACGAHAGDLWSMTRTVELAAELGLAIGAHPGYPDPAGFGRRQLGLAPDELRATLIEQLERLAGVCADRGATLSHVKAHGALYNAAARDAELARIVAEAARDTGHVALFGLPGSALLAAARDAGLRGVSEGFADRSYEPDGTLRPRALEDALLALPELVASQAIHLASDGGVTAIDGTWIAVPAETICLHGDSPDVVASAQAVREALDSVGVEVRRFDAP